jgi:hypothetical protein
MPLWFAIVFVQSTDDRQSPEDFKSVIDAFSHSLCLDLLFISPYSESLRQCGLTDSVQIFLLTYRQLYFGQLAKNHQAVWVG